MLTFLRNFIRKIIMNQDDGAHFLNEGAFNNLFVFVFRIIVVVLRHHCRHLQIRALLFCLESCSSCYSLTSYASCVSSSWCYALTSSSRCLQEYHVCVDVCLFEVLMILLKIIILCFLVLVWIEVALIMFIFKMVIVQRIKTQNFCWAHGNLSVKCKLCTSWKCYKLGKNSNYF